MAVHCILVGILAEERNDNTKFTWADYAKSAFSIISSRHRYAERIVCVNDVYDSAYSTKEDERDLRLHGQGHIPNACMKLDESLLLTAKGKHYRC